MFQVSAEVSRRSLSLAVDSSKPGSVSIRGNQLDVEKRLYLGGLPHAHTTRRINVRHFFFCNNQSKVSFNVAVSHRGCCTSCIWSVDPATFPPPSLPPQISSSFQGCIRSVHLNGAVLDLSKPASRHNVTSCFTNDQAGSYLDGSGYAIFSESNTRSIKSILLQSGYIWSVCVCVFSVRDGYKVGSDVSVSLEFRTSQSEGVFLGISSAKIDAIGLEMIKGQVSRHYLCVYTQVCVIIDTNWPVFCRWCLTWIMGRGEW